MTQRDTPGGNDAKTSGDGSHNLVPVRASSGEQPVAFLASAFYAALDRVRIERKLTWKNVADQTHLSSSTFVRLGHGKQPDIRTFAAVIEWANLDVATFFSGHEDTTPTLVKIIALIYADATLPESKQETLDTVFSMLWGPLSNGNH